VIIVTLREPILSNIDTGFKSYDCYKFVTKPPKVLEYAPTL
jgi:hypothetical protein